MSTFPSTVKPNSAFWMMKYLKIILYIGIQKKNIFCEPEGDIEIAAVESNVDEEEADCDENIAEVSVSRQEDVEEDARGEQQVDTRDEKHETRALIENTLECFLAGEQFE